MKFTLKPFTANPATAAPTARIARVLALNLLALIDGFAAAATTTAAVLFALTLAAPAAANTASTEIWIILGGFGAAFVGILAVSALLNTLPAEGITISVPIGLWIGTRSYPLRRNSGGRFLPLDTRFRAAGVTFARIHVS